MTLTHLFRAKRRILKKFKKAIDWDDNINLQVLRFYSRYRHVKQYVEIIFLCTSRGIHEKIQNNNIIK